MYVPMASAGGAPSNQAFHWRIGSDGRPFVVRPATGTATTVSLLSVSRETKTWTTGRSSTTESSFNQRFSREYVAGEYAARNPYY